LQHRLAGLYFLELLGSLAGLAHLVDLAFPVHLEYPGILALWQHFPAVLVTLDVLVDLADLGVPDVLENPELWLPILEFPVCLECPVRLVVLTE
jgi:hypothetical protein